MNVIQFLEFSRNNKITSQKRTISFITVLTRIKNMYPESITMYNDICTNSMRFNDNRSNYFLIIQ